MKKQGIKKAGSTAYNRLDMQVSQTLCLAIELYDSLDYLFILDHDDDITLFDDHNNNSIVSYYQMKTQDDSFTLNTILSENWINKLYKHLSTPEILIKELGLITNCNLKLDNNIIISAPKTDFQKFNLDVINKIKADIAKKNNTKVNDVDLSKFVHVKTTLSIDRHKDIAEKEMNDFLVDKFPRIKVQTVKTIFASVIELLTKLQAYERLPDNADFKLVKAKKGFTKKTFDKIVQRAIITNIPEFDEVKKFANGLNSDELSIAYVSVLTDNNSNSTIFHKAFKDIEGIMSNIELQKGESLFDYIQKCKAIYSDKFPKSMLLYSQPNLYIEILIIIILINQQGLQ